MSADTIQQDRYAHARALVTGTLPDQIDTTLAEALVIGLLRQDVRIFVSVFGHGSTEVGDVLRIYQEQGLLRVLGLRSEIEASHAAAALRWCTGQKAAVITSIGPGALQAMAASLVPASDGIGVWYLLGDETSEDEGYNMQQIPHPQQQQFLKLFSVMGQAYSLHTPGGLPTALRRGLNTVDHPFKAGPFYLLMPMNTQPAVMPGFNLDELPAGAPPLLGEAACDYGKAADWIRSAKKVIVKIGGGARTAGSELINLLDLANGVLVHTPIATGIYPYSNSRNMGVGGSKGSLCGNFAMQNADLLIAIGTRAVCQSDCSRTGYPNVEKVININAEIDDATHYGKTIAMVGDVAATLRLLNAALEKSKDRVKSDQWLRDCGVQKTAWQAFKAERRDNPVLHDEFWGKPVLTQPAAIIAVAEWARQNKASLFFDAGDVQANGFQIVEDECPGQTFTETGASYMGFAVSALLASAAAPDIPYPVAVTGDGSFTMSPQVLIDGVEFGAHGCILLLDNNRMAAISGLQIAQYGADFATHHSQPVDYLACGRSIKGILALDGGNSIQSLTQALDKAKSHPGLSLIHVPAYYGSDPLGGMGVYGRWNVGNWVTDTQALRHKIGL
jgi:3D-(3,5/4)-trihydroxycyclohexane-1,2-dione acylhydrolase (decyclizing)